LAQIKYPKTTRKRRQSELRKATEAEALRKADERAKKSFEQNFKFRASQIEGIKALAKQRRRTKIWEILGSERG